MDYIEKNKSGAGLQGIKGWLLLFCISRTIGSPLLNSYFLITLFLKLGEYIYVPEVLTYYLIHTWVLVIETAFGMFAAIRLWTIRTNAVKTVKIYLIVSFGLIMFTMFIPLLAGYGLVFFTESLKNNLTNIIRRLILNMIWYAYFSRSARVTNVYNS